MKEALIKFCAVMAKENLWIDNIIHRLVDKVKNEASLETFESLLSYLGETDLSFNDINFLN